MEPGDLMCLSCGAVLAPALSSSQPGDEDPPPVSVTTIEGWRLAKRLPPPDSSPWERFIVEHEARGQKALLTLYRERCEPDTAVYEVLRQMPRDHIPESLATGRFEGRAFDVVELVNGASLAESGFSDFRPENVRPFIAELGRALSEFLEAGLRHRDLRPKNILIRSTNPFDLVVTGFGSARLSDFDLESVSPLTLTRYSSPETIVGAVSSASDWWSLGMVVLECVTRGACFDGVNDQAFLLHVVTRGMELPGDLEPDTRVLLRGLLARDPLIRWSWPQVRAWLNNEPVEAPPEAAVRPEQAGPPIVLAGREHNRPESFALAAAEAANWDQARELTLRGVLVQWLEEKGADTQMISEVRRVVGDDVLPDDHRHALALMALNRDLPVVLAGEIVTPAWLLTNLEVAYDLVTGPLPNHLERMGREPWLVRLRTRADAIRERARILEIELDEPRARTALLATSRANLEVERDRLRVLFPDTEHAGLSSIMEKAKLPDEDLIILVSAALTQFVPLESLVKDARDLAERTSIEFDQAAVPRLLSQPRREIFAAVGDRIANFARCGVDRVDEWADSFRIEGRMPLPRAVVLLSIPKDRWKEPPKQQYVANLLEHFEKRVAGTVARGPLVRFVIGKTTPRVDLAELQAAGQSAEALINHLIARTDVQITLDPLSYTTDPLLGDRLRRLVNQASTFRRDTGIDGRYMGFPFLLTRDGRQTTKSGSPRIAPVLLWPVTVDMPSGIGQGARIAFDREREDVRLNPALEGIVGSANFAKWKSARAELLAKQTLRVGDVIDIFATFARPRGRSIVRVPSKDIKVESGTSEIVPAAALLNAEFTGQAVAEDLRQIRGQPLSGTVLEVALRLAEPASEAAAEPSAELERYQTVESDPSQENAVQRSRAAPGLVVEGPPGTGKSQTIVNIVANAIGHRQTVLIVCQKQAALQVVKKRLEAEGLGDRLFALRDINKDRAELLGALRSQVDAVHSAPAGRAAALRRQREERAGRIEVIERELDRHHKALQFLDDATGLSYRAVLSELVGLETTGSITPAPQLRQVVGRMRSSELSSMEEICGPLARTWLASGFEESPLVVLRQFAADDGTAELIQQDLDAFLKADAHRAALAARAVPGFDTEDPAAIRSWLNREAAFLEGLDDVVRQRLAGWLDLFRPAGATKPPGDALVSRLEEFMHSLSQIDATAHDLAVFARLTEKTDDTLASIIADLDSWGRKPNVFGKLNPARWRMRRRVRAVATNLQIQATDEPLRRLRATAAVEVRLRPLRVELARIRTTLGIAAMTEKEDIAAFIGSSQSLLMQIRIVRDAAKAVLACPAFDLAVAAAKSRSREPFTTLRNLLVEACARCDARQASFAALERLSEWVDADYIRTWRERLVLGESTAALAEKIKAGLVKLTAYQSFRARASSLPQAALQIFSILRSVEGSLMSGPEAKLDHVVRRTLRREALLATKARLESAHPELLYERSELEAKVAALGRLDIEVRDLNKHVLASDIDVQRVARPVDWVGITRLTGPRAKRLREILDEGPDKGLMQLRPVWLMNPDVASRVLPLHAGLFDLVVYDEASQMPVEHAVPTLFRAKRAVISGDEKQMPPSSFFSASIDDDDDSVHDEELDDGATDAERAAREEKWNHREIKDCPDLLQLGRATLPSTTLQIHYRSKYRELIGFSNAAFYAGNLSVPARHPEDEIRRALPIEVIRVDGVYSNQTNSDEVQRVVSVLERYWANPASLCPSIGVVTFNRKQADLIEEAIEHRAAADEGFASALRRERDRVQDNEDMGFFVKNVENVQGDERDIIIFSTTFGRDARGTFRRNFGVLGSVGGERRLNVAVTRAREKVVLITSMPIKDVSDWLASGRPPAKPRDYLQAYLDHAERVHGCDPIAIRNSAARLTSSTPSRAGTTLGAADHDGFVKAVAEYIAELGRDPVSVQDAGDAFGLDFAVVDPRTGLFGIGIECDAPIHPLLAKARAREIWRKTVLCRGIPVIHRISSRDWYNHPAAEKARLSEALRNALG